MRFDNSVVQKLPERFEELEVVRFHLLRVKATAPSLPMSALLHEANNLATAAYAWSVLQTDERRAIDERIARLIAVWNELTNQPA